MLICDCYLCVVLSVLLLQDIALRPIVEHICFTFFPANFECNVKN